jgi:hypothetical protein
MRLRELTNFPHPQFRPKIRFVACPGRFAPPRGTRFLIDCPYFVLNMLHALHVARPARFLSVRPWQPRHEVLIPSTCLKNPHTHNARGWDDADHRSSTGSPSPLRSLAACPRMAHGTSQRQPALNGHLRSSRASSRELLFNPYPHFRRRGRSIRLNARGRTCAMRA